MANLQKKRTYLRAIYFVLPQVKYHSTTQLKLTSFLGLKPLKTREKRQKVKKTCEKYCQNAPDDILTYFSGEKNLLE